MDSFFLDTQYVPATFWLQFTVIVVFWVGNATMLKEKHSLTKDLLLPRNVRKKNY